MLIDNVCEKGECDFVRDLAAPLPMAVIGDMLGVAPHERAKLLAWSDDLVTILSSKVSEGALIKAGEAYAGYVNYVRPKLEERRDNPADDLFSVLTHAEIEGQKLSDDEILSETLLILLAGDETTRHTLSGGTEQLLRHQDQWEQLKATPDLFTGALEEMLRWTSPVKNMCRTVTHDTDFLGEALSEGEKVMLMFESANFDEEVFDDPDEFRIQRDPNNHLAFGFGTHFCLGNQLARLEITLMTRKLMERLPDIRLADDAALPLRPANFVSGLEAMPVVFTPTRPLN
jgi:cytochrome P450 family 142 subfamily A polypeptide 1